jgi:hypothetical protein
VHVIEHLNRPTQSLLHLRSILRPGGRLYVECPNLTAPPAVRSKLFHFAHIHNFTPSSLRMLAEKCGFAVESALSSADDPNLQMLLVRREQVDEERRIDPHNYRRTLERLRRANPLAYYLRPDYLLVRTGKLLSYAEERLTARKFAARIEARCQNAASRAGEPLHGPHFDGEGRRSPAAAPPARSGS